MVLLYVAKPAYADEGEGEYAEDCNGAGYPMHTVAVGVTPTDAQCPTDNCKTGNCGPTAPAYRQCTCCM